MCWNAPYRGARAVFDAMLRGRFGAPVRVALTLAFVLLSMNLTFVATLVALAWVVPTGLVATDASPSVGTPLPPTTGQMASIALAAIVPTALVLGFAAPTFALLGRLPARGGVIRFLIATLPVTCAGYALIYGGWLSLPEGIVLAIALAWALLLALCYGRSGWTGREDAP